MVYVLHAVNSHYLSNLPDQVDRHMTESFRDIVFEEKSWCVTLHSMNTSQDFSKILHAIIPYSCVLSWDEVIKGVITSTLVYDKLHSSGMRFWYSTNRATVNAK